MDNMQSQAVTTQKEQVSLKQVLLIFGQWISYLWSKKILLIIAVIVGAVVGLIYSYVRKPTYEASLTFVLEDSQSGGLGGYAGIASQFGIDLGSLGGGTSGVFSGDNIIDFLTSRLMVEKALLSPDLPGSKQSLADRFATLKELPEKWAKKSPELANIHFPPDLPRDKFTPMQDSCLGAIYKLVTDKYLDISKTYKTSSFIMVTCTSSDPIFAKFFTEKLVKEATTFYVKTKTQRAQANVDHIQHTADSIESELNKKTYALAFSQDRNVNPLRSAATVSTDVMNRDKLVLQTMYAEVVKNLELSKLSMMQETPIIQIVDTPILPLVNKNFGLALSAIIGGLVLGFVMMMFLMVRLFYRRVML